MKKSIVRQPKSTARQYAESMGLALILAIVMRSSFVQAYVIPSGSMEPTILVGDRIFVNKVAYGLRIPETIAGVPVRTFFREIFVSLRADSSRRHHRVYSSL
jgi:signal peptidase I